jgi:DNA uptake protein ComE-like DNA-binding protein
VTALLELPGVDGDVATQIVETREQVDGFSSLEDLGATLDLDGDLVEQLRGRVVFLPREARPSPKPSSADHAD